MLNWRPIVFALGTLSAVGVAGWLGWHLRPAVPLTPVPAAPVGHLLRLRPTEREWDTSDDAVATVDDQGAAAPRHNELPERVSLHRRQSLGVRVSGKPLGTERPVEVTLSHLQVTVDDGSAVALLPPPAVLALPLPLETTDTGGLSRVDWPAPWRRDGMNEGDYDVDLSLLFPTLPRDSVQAGATWTSARSAVPSMLLGSAYQWQTHATWRLTRVLDGLAVIDWTTADTAAGLPGTRQGQGTLEFDTDSGTVRRAEVTVRSNVTWQSGARTVRWTEERHVLEVLKAAPGGSTPYRAPTPPDTTVGK